MDDPRFWILLAGEIILAGIGLKNYWCCRRGQPEHDDELRELRKEFQGHRSEIAELLKNGINVTVTRVMEKELDDAGPQKT